VIQESKQNIKNIIVTSSVTLQEKNKKIHKPSNFVRSITVNGIFLFETQKKSFLNLLQFRTFEINEFRACNMDTISKLRLMVL
jgi:hypothetical protein